MWPDSLKTECAQWWQWISSHSPETSPAPKWPVPALGPEECDTSRCTDAPETWSPRGDHSTVHYSWTCDPAGRRTDYQTRGTAGIRLVETKALQARLHVEIYLHFTDVVPLQALDHWFHLILHACLVSLSHLCSSREVFTETSLSNNPDRTGSTCGVHGQTIAKRLYNVIW